MTNRKIPWILLFLLVIFVGGCQGLSDSTELEEEEIGQEQVGDIKYPVDSELKIPMRIPKTLNPILNMDKTVDQTLKLIFDTLVDFDENDQVIPAIASSWNRSEDGTVVTIQINNSIKWHDGTPLTAADVEFSLKSIQDAQVSPYKTCIKNISSYKAISNDQVQIVYNKPFSGYAESLYFPVIPSHVGGLATNPIGTGVYQFESLLSTRKMTLKANDNYYKGVTNIKSIEVLFTPDPESDLYSFDQGLTDIVNTDVIDWEKYGKNKKSSIYEYTTRAYEYIGINFNKPILQDTKLRKALLYGTNREYILEKIYLYHGVSSDVPVSPESWLYDPMSKQYESDIKKAKELLEGKTITLTLLINKENLQRKEVAMTLQKMYKDIGIDLEIIEADKEVFKERITSGQFDLFLGGWNLSIIPDLSFAFDSTNIVGGSNYGAYVSSEMDALLKENLAAPNNQKLQETYSKLQMHISNQLPYLSLYFRNSAFIVNEKIKGNIKPHHMNVYQNIHEWYINEGA